MENSNKEKDQDRENKLLEVLDYSETQFDKQLTYLSSGALILSIGFVKDIVKITEDTDTSNLITSWILFTSALLLNLISHLTSIHSIRTEIKGRERLSEYLDRSTWILNILSMILLISGIGMFIRFAYINF